VTRFKVYEGENKVIVYDEGAQCTRLVFPAEPGATSRANVAAGRLGFIFSRSMQERPRPKRINQYWNTIINLGAEVIIDHDERSRFDPRATSAYRDVTGVESLR
jgi:hypothetical protein